MPLSIRCPHCRHPCSHVEILFASHRTRFTCKRCGSILKLDMQRRYLMLVPIILLVITLVAFILATTNADDRVCIPAALLVTIIVVFRFDRMLVIEARGAYCRHCGYNLRGCTGSICTECGREHDFTTAQVTPVDDSDAHIDECNVATGLPREHLSRDVILRSWIKMAQMVLLMPGSVMTVLGRDGSVVRAWCFALLTLSISLMIFTIPGTLAIVSPYRDGFGDLVKLYGMLAITLCCLMVALGIWIISTHCILNVTGGCREPIRITAQALLYGSAVMPVGAVIEVCCFGYPVAVIWWLIVAIVMVREGQGVGIARATIAVVVFPLFIALCASVILWRYYQV